jgi:undecaprenyl-diphosphatase
VAGWERDVAEALYSLPAWTTTPLEVVMQVGTRAAVVVVALGLLVARRSRTAAVALVSGLSAWALAEALKRVVDRPRPSLATLGEVPRHIESSPGFPSTHSAVAAALAVVLLFDRGVPRPVVAMAVVAAALTMVARVHLGVHWPLDVLGGAAVGAFVAAVVSVATRAVARR